MPKYVTPEVQLIGGTALNRDGLTQYLKDTGNEEFNKDIFEGCTNLDGLTDVDIMCSFFAKLCYRSLVADGKNKNISRVRSIRDNVTATLASGHGSVFEHAVLNFVVYNCSRVFTHELVRHRAGTAFSQTSGRYVRGDTIDFVLDPAPRDVARLKATPGVEVVEGMENRVLFIGMDQAREDDTERAVRAGLAMLAAGREQAEAALAPEIDLPEAVACCVVALQEEGIAR